MAQQLAQALRTVRLTVVVGAAGAGKSSLFASVMPLLRRRAADMSPAASDGVVVPFPERRSRTAEGGQRELIHALDRWDDASMQSLQRALDEGGPARGRRALADALTPGNLADHCERHEGARLLFVFDHFEGLLEAGRLRVSHRRLIETWAAAVRSPQLRANFLVAVDERSWPWMHAVCVGLPASHWNALRLYGRMGERTLEPMALARHATPALSRRPPGITPRPGKAVTNAEFLQSLNHRVQRVAQAARDAQARNDDFAASVPYLADAPTPRVAPQVVAGKAVPEPVAREPTTLERPTTVPAEAAVDPPPAADIDGHAAEQARDSANARNTEPAAPVADDHDVEPAAAPEFAPTVALDDAADATVATAPVPTSVRVDGPFADSRFDARVVPPQKSREWTPALLGLLALAAGVAIGVWLLHTPADSSGAGMRQPEVAPAPQVAPAAPADPAAPPVPAPPPAPAPTTDAKPSATAFAALGLSAGGEHARIAREFVAALPDELAQPRIEPLARGVDPVAWLQQAPGRLGIARWDALRTAPQNTPVAALTVLTPLFAEPVLFIVRADSPMRTIRQLQGKRISVGPAHSDAAHTVREVLRRQLGTAPADTVALAPDDAIAELVAFGTLDAIAVVDAQPMAWWGTIDPGVARRLRVLTLNPGHPQDRRLIDSMGTPPLRINLAGTQGGAALVPAVMSYLVASGDADANADERLAALAQALCRELPQLQKQGHPAWRDLRPRAQLDTGWPVAQSFRLTVSRCVRAV